MSQKYYQIKGDEIIVYRDLLEVPKYLRTNLADQMIDDGYVMLGRLELTNEVDADKNPVYRKHSQQLITRKKLQQLLNISPNWHDSLEKAQAQVVRNLKAEIERQKVHLEMRGNLNDHYVKIIEENKVKEIEYESKDLLLAIQKEIIERKNKEIKDLKELSANLAERNNELLKGIELRKTCAETYYDRAENLEEALEIIRMNAVKALGAASIKTTKSEVQNEEKKRFVR